MGNRFLIQLIMGRRPKAKSAYYGYCAGCLRSLILVFLLELTLPDSVDGQADSSSNHQRPYWAVGFWDAGPSRYPLLQFSAEFGKHLKKGRTLSYQAVLFHRKRYQAIQPSVAFRIPLINRNGRFDVLIGPELFVYHSWYNGPQGRELGLYAGFGIVPTLRLTKRIHLTIDLKPHDGLFWIENRGRFLPKRYGGGILSLVCIRYEFGKLL